MRRATPAELSRWDDLVVDNPGGGHILQSRAWGEFKRRHGWRPRYLLHEARGMRLAALFLVRHIPGLGELWYCPKGPGVGRAEQLPDVLADRTAFPDAFALKVEPELEEGAPGLESWPAAGLVRARQDVQISRATIIVDLRPDEKALLASFKPKCRYNIRLAARRGVEVRRVTVDDSTIDIMYRLMASTQARAGFPLRSRDYFAGYWRLQHACEQGEMLLALAGGEVLAGAFVTHLGARAWYKDGGSVKRRSELMAPYLLQWEVIRWLRSRGIESYDLVAVPRPSELSADHPLFGLHRFKSGFSDRVTEFVGSWDLPLSPARYRLWTRVGEGLAHRWSVGVRHDLFY